MAETYALELDPRFAVTVRATPQIDASSALALLLGTEYLACADVPGTDLLLWFDPAGHAHGRTPNRLASIVLAKLSGGPTMPIHGYAILTGGPAQQPQMFEAHRCNRVMRDLFGVTPFAPAPGDRDTEPNTTA